MIRISCWLAILPIACSAIAAPVQYSATDAGTIYLGAVADGDWGRPLASGDLDGDGYDEVIVAASESYGGVISQVSVIRGGPAANGRGTVDLFVGGVDQVILGAAVDDNLGASIASGDVTGDNIDDLLICASNADFGGLQSAGIAYLIFGSADFFDSATRDLSVVGSWDMRIVGPVEGGDMGGANLFGGLDAHGAAIGRLNDDPYGDMVLGVHLADGGGSASGRVYVVPGGPFPSGFTLNLSSPTTYEVRIDGADSYDELGTFVLTGDLTGDGIEELILPNEYASRGLFTSEGAVHIFRGRAAWPSFISLSTTPADITLIGDRESDELGAAAAVGDFNNDGITDLAAAAPGADAGEFTDQIGDGFVYGMLGSAAYQLGTHTIDYATDSADFLFIGEYQEGLGAEVSAGDFNGDGYCDVAAAERFGGPQTNGVVEVLFGRDFFGSPSFTANVDTDVRIVGAPQDRIGFSLSASDVNGDGLAEVLFGTPFNNNYWGTAYVFTHATGDFNHDGNLDLLDFAAFQGCFTGQATTPALAAGCFVFDYDFDSDVDLGDFETLSADLDGPQP